jgi:hypothetical protein
LDGINRAIYMKYTSTISSNFIIRPAISGEEEVLYNLICELAYYEGKDVASLPLTKEKLYAFGFNDKPYFHTEFAECSGQIVGYALYYYTFSGSPKL